MEKEAKIQAAIRAFQAKEYKSVRAAARAFSVHSPCQPQQCTMALLDDFHGCMLMNQLKFFQTPKKRRFVSSVLLWPEEQASALARLGSESEPTNHTCCWKGFILHPSTSTLHIPATGAIVQPGLVGPLHIPATNAIVIAAFRGPVVSISLYTEWLPRSLSK